MGDAPVEPSPSTAPPSHPVDRRTTIAVSLIAVGGVVIGGLVAAGSSWWTANKTAESGNVQALDEYRRDARRDVYLKTLTDFDKLSDWEHQLDSDIDSKQESGQRYSDQQASEKLQVERQAFIRYYGAVKDDCTTNELIASRRITDVCRAMLDANVTYVLKYEKSLRAVTGTAQSQNGNDESGGGGGSWDVPDDLVNLSNFELRAEFVEAARTDLGATD